MQHTLSNLIMGLKNWPRRSLSQSVCVPVFLWIEIGCVCWWILAPNPTSCPPAALKNWRDELWFATVLSNWFSFRTFHNWLASGYFAGSPDFDMGEKNLDRQIIHIVVFFFYTQIVNPCQEKHFTTSVSDSFICSNFEPLHSEPL